MPQLMNYHEQTKGKYNVPGFRKGHVPRRVLENTYGKGIFFEDALYAIETANKAGYNIVGINDISEKADPNEVKKLCNYYINDYSEIFSLFE